jgi:hypothetical protein
LLLFKRKSYISIVFFHIRILPVKQGRKIFETGSGN